MEDYYENFHTELANTTACHFSSSHALFPGLAPPPDGFQSGDYPEWIRRRAGKLLEKNARSSSCGEEVGNKDADQGTNLWHKIMSFTKVKTKNSRDSKTKEPAQAPGEDLEQLWQQVSTVLQSSPTTLALATQKHYFYEYKLNLHLKRGHVKEEMVVVETNLVGRKVIIKHEIQEDSEETKDEGRDDLMDDAGGNDEVFEDDEETEDDVD
ncbi:hypothetical protein SELMODRAFT_417901 [Selaginella moellendorffii]|uniref:Uncharacterized protein n=1 Tax=Selaginella moellendorffii TaxID=88036 RepID=D8S411_SELML|nr:hypothetical protein SELMODRAFT_417901 [Selaginella moellendorffii]